MLIQLTEDNYTFFAMKSYCNPGCTSVDEFHEDLNRTKYLKRLFRRYDSTGQLRERLILNHIIIFYNVFGVEPATRLLFFKIEEELHSLLKTFLVYLNYCPEQNLPESKNLIGLGLNEKVIKVLRELDEHAT
ncbi:MAG: hypothetical protein QQN46_02105 [Nitrosopumilus sp.]